MRPELLLASLLILVAPAAQAQWQILDAHTTADLRGIDNVGHGIVWASGTQGTVLRSLDDGKSWITCTTPPDAAKLDFRGIQAFDANTAIVMSSGKGDLSRLYKTTDGCKTWKLLFTNPDKDGFFDSVTRESSTDQTSADMLIVGDPVQHAFTLFTLRVPLPGNAAPTLVPFPAPACPHPPRLQLAPTTDTCPSRMPQYRSPIPRDGESLFAASNSSLATDPKAWYPNIAFITGGPHGARFLQYRGTSCGGMGCEEWIVADLPLASGDSGGAFSIGTTGEPLFRGVIVGGDYKKPDTSTGTAAFTEESGKNALEENVGRVWLASSTPPHGYRSAVAYDASAKTWITVGPNGTDISADDGRNWQALLPSLGEAADTAQHWNALSLPFVVGPHGRIGKLREDALRRPMH
jgi:hypothetical protein